MVRVNTFDMDPVVPSRSPVRTAVKTVSTLVVERKDYVIGIALLLIVVLFWAASNFLTQVSTINFTVMRGLIGYTGHIPRRI